MSIVNTLTSQNEIVLSERVVTTDYRVTEIREHITERYVQVQIELGPFTTVNRGTEDNPVMETNGTGRRNINVWSGDEYDAIRDTWTNTDLLAAVATKI